jgi:hypothetical protein
MKVTYSGDAKLHKIILSDLIPGRLLHFLALGEQVSDVYARYNDNNMSIQIRDAGKVADIYLQPEVDGEDMVMTSMFVPIPTASGLSILFVDSKMFTDEGSGRQEIALGNST